MLIHLLFLTFYFLLIIKKLLKKKNHKNINGSCDTEDWSNDAENSAAHHRNKLFYKIY